MKLRTIDSLRAIMESCMKEYRAAVDRCSASYLEAQKDYEQADHFNFGAFNQTQRRLTKADDVFKQHTAEINRRFREAVAELEKEIREENPDMREPEDPSLLKELDALKKAALLLFLYDPAGGEKKTIHGTPFLTPRFPEEQAAAEGSAKRLIDAIERDFEACYHD